MDPVYRRRHGVLWLFYQKYVTRQITFWKPGNPEHYYFPTVKPNLPFINASKKQNIPPQLPSHNASCTEKPYILLSMALAEQLQQRMSFASTCVVYPITTTSLSRQPHNIPTMTQPPSDGVLFFEEMKMVWPNSILSIYSTWNWFKTYSSNIKQQSWSKLIRNSKICQRLPSTHSNQQILILKQSLTEEAHARLVQHQQQQ